MIKVKVMNEYQMEAMLDSDIEINYDNFFKDDLISMLKVCRNRYKKECKKTANLENALNEIKEYCKDISVLYWVDDDEPKYVSKDILQIIDKVLGDEK